MANRRRFPASLMAIGAVLLTFACAGLKARQSTLLPAMKLAWAGVREDVRVGSDDVYVQEQVAQMDEGFQKDSVILVLRVDWPTLRMAAVTGIARRINDGEIGNGVAQSLLERLGKFEEALNKLKGGVR